MREKEMPVFIKIEEYKEVIEIMKLIRNKIEDAKRILYKINELKNKEDAEIAEWNSNINEIEGKISEIDNSMFGPETF